MEGNESDHRICNPALSEELANEVEKIKGDAIGNTLYSERWVIKTLLKLAQFEDEEMNDDFESQLCLLWDMSIEKDVVAFLMKHDFLSIGTKVIQSRGNLRLIEIMVGVIGNMCCVESVREELSRREPTVNTLLALFELPDSATLIQLVRLFHSTAWDLVHNPDFGPHWLENEFRSARLSSNISFILSSSTNEELIFSVLDLLHTICNFNINDKDFSQFFSNEELVNGLVECWHQIFGNWSQDEDLPSKYHIKAIKHWILILRSFAGHTKGRTSMCQHAAKLGEILNKLANCSSDFIETIFPSIVILMEALVRDYFNPVTFQNLLKIFHHLYQNTGENEGVELRDCIESYCTSINSFVPQDVIESSLKSCNEDYVLLFWKVIKDRKDEVESRDTFFK